MTQVKFSFKRPDMDGLQPVEGSLRFRPYRRYATGDSVVVPRTFDVALDGKGEAVVELTPTGDLFVWMVTELLMPDDNGSPDYTFVRYVRVPDSEDPLAYAALEDADLGVNQ